MKKIFVRLIALLLMTASLAATGCDQSGYISGLINSSNQSTTDTSSTKYPPATTPSQSETGQTASTQKPEKTEKENPLNDEIENLVTQKYLTVHEKSRPGYKLEELKNIVIHYVANPGTSALQNWRYFENKNYVSAHFIIDLDGSIIQCMPLDEVAWAIGTTEGNYSTISIECCHPDQTGKFTDATYDSLVKLVSWLCMEFDLSAEQVKRHYDYPRTNSSGVVWHKFCPIYFVEHPEEWEKFKEALMID
jgi:hypothetical protein